jgi:CheY-like chemotaxis protein
VRILVVDDTETMRLLLSRYLGTLGHEVTAVGSGLEVPTLLKARAFDAVVTDVAMPECSGWEVLRAARAAHPGLPVIFMTGWDDTHGREAGGVAPDAVLDKPVTLERIREVLDAIGRAALGSRGAGDAPAYPP